jgi:hypothetical protein
VDDIEKVKERIAKLLKMAADESSPNEAAIAAGRARALMDKYQLDAFDIGNRIEEEFGAIPATRFYAAIPQYLSVLSVAVARYNDCQARFENGTVDYKKKDDDIKQRGKRVTFLGYKSDVDLAAQMLDRLHDAINRLCKEHLRDRGYDKYPVRIGGAFKTGAVMTIIQRINAMTAERDALTTNATASGPGTSLVVLKKAAVDDHFGNVEYDGVRYKTPEDAAEHEALQTGKIRGATVEINRLVQEA